MQFVKPCEGYITSLYSSARLDPVTNKGVRPHWGIDYGSATNNKIWAAASGYVRYIGWGHATAGNYIVIRHPNGWETAYLHLQTIAVSTKQYVSQSQYIGMKGSTGNSTGVHLHFEMSKGTWPGGYANHVNPAIYIIDSTVKEIQEQLNRLGYSLVVDGLQGDATTKAVMDYQKSRSLPVNGVADHLTRSKLTKEIAEREKPSPPIVLPIGKEGIMLELNQRQREELANVYQYARELGVFSSDEHEKEMREGKMTVSKAIYLNGLIAGAALADGKRIGG